jgi:hypothetical protein
VGRGDERTAAPGDWDARGEGRRQSRNSQAVYTLRDGRGHGSTRS